MSDRRKSDAAFIEPPAPTAPKLADVHPAFRRALADVMRLEAEHAALLYPEHPPELDIADPVQRASAVRGRRVEADRLGMALLRAKEALAVERAAASGKVVCAV